jgi:hypothetical protein
MMVHSDGEDEEDDDEDDDENEEGSDDYEPGMLAVGEFHDGSLIFVRMKLKLVT